MLSRSIFQSASIWPFVRNYALIVLEYYINAPRVGAIAASSSHLVWGSVRILFEISTVLLLMLCAHFGRSLANGGIGKKVYCANA